jgi:hypothetical protein
MLREAELRHQAKALRATRRAACWPEIHSGIWEMKRYAGCHLKPLRT